ncbi:MAG TPA: hypothetical protein VGQ12_07670 [Candidatus Angelobacter sp.]|jgi:hypothetical protein|nr:hypothetical protein [Candidatus Angelobacter sp.]
MPAQRQIALNGSGGAMVAIVSTIPARRVRVREDEAAAAVGLQYLLPNDNFTQQYVVGVPGSPPAPQIDLGNSVGQGNNQGPILGWPAQNIGGATAPSAATTYLKARSKAAGVTNVNVTEDE